VSQRTAMLRLESFAGGLNDTDPPHRIGDDQLAVATDIELTNSGGIRRRAGVARAMGPPTTGVAFQALIRHTPSQLLTATEVWAMAANASSFYRSTTGTTWTTVANNATSANVNMAISDAVSFNGKLYIAYKKSASTDRLTVWDGSVIRPSGLSTPAAPTAADTGSGSYAATVRYYKVQFEYTNGDSKYTLSDLSAALTFTPIGTGTGVVVTKPTTPDGATAWRLWASADNVSYTLIGSAVVATTTITDSTAPASYVATALIAAESDTYTPAWSAKYLLVDENRLLIAGAFETARYVSRIGWSAIIGTARTAYGESSHISDDERFPSGNFIDLDSDEGGDLTGMEMLNGSVYVFKRYAIYKLVRTGDTTAPYKPVTISKVIGALSRKAIVPGEDASGSPCLYFLSERGPYRLGNGGLQYLGGDIETLWATALKRGYSVPPHGVYDPTMGQVRWWIPTTVTSTYPDTQIVYHVRHGQAENSGRVVGGWTTTASTSKPMYVSASAMLPTDLSNRDSALAPHAIHSNGAHSYQPVVWKYTTAQASDDTLNTTTGAVTGTESFSPIATTKTFSLGLGDQAGVNDVYIACVPSAGGTTLAVTLARDFAAESRSASQAFTGTTTRSPKQIVDLTMAQAQYVSVSLTSSTQTAFTVDEIALRVRREEPV
jgi:hypothetical protein